LYVATVAYGCFKSRSVVAYGMCVGSGWRRGRSPWQRGPATRALACSLSGYHLTLAPRIGRQALASMKKHNYPVCLTLDSWCNVSQRNFISGGRTGKEKLDRL
jgi:hypothetical protein